MMRTPHRSRSGGLPTFGRRPRWPWTPLAVATLALALVLASACVGRPALPGFQGTPELPTTLEVVNRALFDMTVYVLPEMGLRERLGTVTSLGTAWFTIPRRLMSSGVTNLRFEADPFASDRAHVSQMIPVMPGDTVQLIIPPN